MLIEISPVEILALKKLITLNTALAANFASSRTQAELMALTRVLSDLSKRAEVDNARRGT